MTRPARWVRSTRWMNAVGLAAFGALTVSSSAHASGAAYYGAQCSDAYRSTPNVDDQGGPHGSYLMLNRCGQGAADLEITNAGSGSVRNQGGQFVVSAPAGTTIHEIHLDANLRRGSGHRSEVAVFNGSSVIPLVVGPDSNPQWAHYDFGGLNAPQLVLRLYCSDASCPADATAHLYARNIVVLLADQADPQVASVGGSLLDNGWRRGVQSLTAAGQDSGAGISLLDASVNGTQVAVAGACDTGGLGFPYTGPLVPCQGSAQIVQLVDTAAAPFHNGSNAVAVTARDYPGNASPPSSRTVLIDNAPPSLTFVGEQDAASPETIRAAVSDQDSGVGSATLYVRAVGAADWQSLQTKIVGGQARAEVNSSAYPPGDYEFRAVAVDVAGNVAETTTTADGDPMRLTFPLRPPVELRAHLNKGGSRSQVVRYGADAKAKGLLLDEAGEPIDGADITIVEHFGAGALLRERVSHATTNEKGKWRSKIPGGPSRDVEATFDGSAAYGAASRSVGTFLVRSRASLQTSRKNVPEGKTVEFEGKVDHYGARIPAGGKLVELQVRVKTGRWQTVGQSFRTNEKGVYRRSYQFGKQYTQDALFRFRLKVKREANWPYKRTNTGLRKVIVRAQ